MDTSTPSTEEAERGSFTGDVPTDCARERAVTIEEDELISVNSLHDHEPNHVEVAGNKVVQEMKTRARSETTLIPKISAQTLRTVGDDEEVAATLPTLNSIRTSLYQSRQQRYPPMPESEDLDFTGEWAVTDKNDTLMQVLS